MFHTGDCKSLAKIVWWQQWVQFLHVPLTEIYDEEIAKDGSEAKNDLFAFCLRKENARWEFISKNLISFDL